MASHKTIILAAFAFLFSLYGAEPLPRWEFVELGLPANSSTVAVDVNDRNEVLGVLGSAGAEVGFLWNDQGTKILNGFGGRTLPRDINNHGVIVGGSLTNGMMRAWMWTNGQNFDLSRGFTNETAAAAINDHGDVIGRVDFPQWYPLLYLLSDPPVQLTPDFGFDTSGPAPPRDLEPRALNNNRYVAARFLESGILHTNLDERNEPLYLSQTSTFLTASDYEGLALNMSNTVAGYFRLYTSARQPGLWTGGRWKALGSTLETGAAAKGINNDGVAVGALDAPATATIWKDGGAADLNALVRLPAGARLIDAVAINNAGYIAATIFENDRTRAVLLRPVAAGVIPRLDLKGVTEAVLEINRVTVSLETDYPATSSRTATFRLHRRYANSYQSGMYTYRVFQTLGVRTNTATGSELTTTFSDLPKGVYLLGGELQDTNGVTLYSAPVMFAVGEPAALRAFRVNWSGQFEFGVEASSGYEYELQESTDLREWKTVPNSVNHGRLFSAAVTNRATFYRTIVKREDLDLEAAAISFPTAPVSIENGRLTLSNRGLLVFTVQFEPDGKYSATYGHSEWTFGGNYRYEPRGGEARLVLEDLNPPPLTIRLELEFAPADRSPFGLWGAQGKARGTMIEGSVSTPIVGTFSFW